MTERPELSLTIFTPDVETAVDTYRGTSDLDERASILNESIVQIEEGIATPDSMRDLVVLASDSHELDQYRPDAVFALTNKNLIAVARGLVAPVEKDPMLMAAEQIERVAKGDSGLTGLVEQETSFRQHVMEELVERLTDAWSNNIEDRELLMSINRLTPDELTDLMEQNQDTVNALLQRVYEIEDPALRKVILDRMPSGEGVSLLDVIDEEVTVSEEDIYGVVAKAEEDEEGFEDPEVGWGSVESLTDEEDDDEDDTEEDR